LAQVVLLVRLTVAAKEMILYFQLLLQLGVAKVAALEAMVVRVVPAAGEEYKIFPAQTSGEQATHLLQLLVKGIMAVTVMVTALQNFHQVVEVELAALE
jgi:hypothetical protein